MCCRVTNSVSQEVDTDSIRLRLIVPEANVVQQLTSLLHSTGDGLCVLTNSILLLPIIWRPTGLALQHPSPEMLNPVPPKASL